MQQTKAFPAARLLAATLAAALMQPAMAAEPAATELAPVDVANLYIKTIINQDEASVASLNAYLRPTRLAGHQSAEYASFSALKAADAQFPVETGKLIADLFPTGMRASLTPAAELLAANVIAAKKGAVCQATKAAPVTVEKNGMQTAAVSFECQIVKVPVAWAPAASSWRRAAARWSNARPACKKSPPRTRPRRGRHGAPYLPSAAKRTRKHGAMISPVKLSMKSGNICNS